MLSANENKVVLPDGTHEVFHEFENIRKLRSNDKVYSNVFCHNDFWANNILINADKMVVIDWELCGYGDAYSDLCHITRFCDTPESAEKLILKNYFGYYEDEMLITLQKMKYVGMTLEVAWAFFHSAVHDPAANQEFDYYRFGKDVVELLLSGKNHF